MRVVTFMINTLIFFDIFLMSLNHNIFPIHIDKILERTRSKHERQNPFKNFIKDVGKDVKNLGKYH